MCCIFRLLASICKRLDHIGWLLRMKCKKCRNHNLRLCNRFSLSVMYTPSPPPIRTRLVHMFVVGQFQISMSIYVKNGYPFLCYAYSIHPSSKTQCSREPSTPRSTTQLHSEYKELSPSKDSKLSFLASNLNPGIIISYTPSLSVCLGISLLIPSIHTVIFTSDYTMLW